MCISAPAELSLMESRLFSPVSAPRLELIIKNSLFGKVHGFETLQPLVNTETAVPCRKDETQVTKLKTAASWPVALLVEGKV